MSAGGEGTLAPSDRAPRPQPRAGVALGRDSAGGPLPTASARAPRSSTRRRVLGSSLRPKPGREQPAGTCTGPSPLLPSPLPSLRPGLAAAAAGRSASGRKCGRAAPQGSLLRLGRAPSRATAPQTPPLPGPGSALGSRLRQPLRHHRPRFRPQGWGWPRPKHDRTQWVNPPSGQDSGSRARAARKAGGGASGGGACQGPAQPRRPLPRLSPRGVGPGLSSAQRLRKPGTKVLQPRGGPAPPLAAPPGQPSEASLGMLSRQGRFSSGSRRLGARGS